MKLTNKNLKSSKKKEIDYLAQADELKPEFLDALPVSYAMFENIYNEEKELVDLRYLYVNKKYAEMVSLPAKKIIGELFSEVFPQQSKDWITSAVESNKTKQQIKAVVYSKDLNHWISYVASPGYKKNTSSFVFVVVDDEIMEKDKMEKDVNTDHFLLEINNILGSDLPYEESIQKVLEETSKIICPDRISIVERIDNTFSSTYEWYKEGLQSELENCQNRPLDHFTKWTDAAKTDIYIDIPDVQAYDFNVGQKEYFQRMGIKHVVILPLFNNGKIFGFITVYSPHSKKTYDGQKLLTTLAYILSTSLIQHRIFVEFEHFSKYDALTNIYSRYGFTLAAKKYMKDNPGQVYTLAVLDIDEFKFINDLYGHALGDQVLKVFAQKIRDNFSEGCLFGRTGGDEFCIILKNQPLEKVETKLNQFALMNHSFEYEGKTYRFTISIGCAEYPSHSQETSELFSLADAALYAVKLHGKNGCQVYNEHLSLSNRSLLGFGLKDISGNIAGAILVYQKEGEKILYANQEALNLFECVNLDELMETTKGTFAGFVHPSDYRRVRESIDKQMIENQNDLSEFVQYRIFTKKGLTKHVLEFGRLTRSNYYGDVFYILLIDRDIILKNQENI